MGKRYRAILRSIGHEVTGEDLQEKHGKASESDAIIIATPTDTHAAVLRSCMALGKPILCEKPIVKDIGALRLLMADCRAAGTRLQMVSQYDYLVGENRGAGLSHWNYFKSGNDGLAWDCIQIISLAKDRPFLSTDSHIWSCSINGQDLHIEDMDDAYYWMIADWLKSPRDDIDRIIKSHEAVVKWEAG
jgi:hypothetical protein